jgi:hypothetical protein
MQHGDVKIDLSDDAFIYIEQKLNLTVALLIYPKLSNSCFRKRFIKANAKDIIILNASEYSFIVSTLVEYQISRFRQIVDP